LAFPIGTRADNRPPLAAVSGVEAPPCVPLCSPVPPVVKILMWKCRAGPRSRQKNVGAVSMLCITKYLTNAHHSTKLALMLDRQHRVRRQRSHSPNSARALDDLRFIRETLERSSAFTAIPGWGQVAMGATALPAAWLAARQASPAMWLTVWLAEAVLACSIGIAATQNKAQRTGVPLTSGPGRKFALSFLPPVVAAAVLTLVLYQAGLARVLPGAWLLLFGAGVLSAGALSVAIVPAMGACFMSLGIAALLFPAWGNLWMALGFGGLHLGFGLSIARRYGG